jgi:uroporphyrin-III C-methyltransferase / precorrin-2 dehydrogenase / sirohydrochlorin ferrochelatase
MNAVSPRNSTALDSELAYLPVFLGLRGRRALLIGDGEAALPKLDLLRRAGASVRRVAGDALEPQHFDGAVLAIDASGDFEVNRRSAALARAARVPINVVDRPALCDFILPAILDHSPVIVAVSTGGLAPAIARLIRQRLEMAIPHSIGCLAMLASRFRQSVAQRLAPRQRMLFWERLFDGDAARLLAGGQAGDACVLAESMIDALETEPVGAALQTLCIESADPELLTVRAARLIRTADVIYYEPWVPSEIIELGRRDALKIVIEAGNGPTICPGRLRVVLRGVNLSDAQRNNDRRTGADKGSSPEVFDAVREVVVPRGQSDAGHHTALALQRWGERNDIGRAHLESPAGCSPL